MQEGRECVNDGVRVAHHEFGVKSLKTSQRLDESLGEVGRKRSISEQPKDKSAKREIEVLDVNDVRKEYEAARARLKLLLKSPKLNEIASCLLSPSEVLALLVSNGLFDCAFQLSTVAGLQLQPIFEGLVSRYVRFVQLPLFDMRNEDSLNEFYDCFTDNDSVIQSFLGTSDSSAIDKMWYLISVYLERHAEPGQTQLHHCVAERLLMSGMAIPSSLKHSYHVPRTIGSIIMSVLSRFPPVNIVKSTIRSH